MSRKIRIEFSRAFYHVFARGNNKQKIFKDKKDYRVYFDRLKKWIKSLKFLMSDPNEEV
jgi:hypothetical protein